MKTNNLATKEDIKRLKQDIKKLEASNRGDIKRLFSYIDYKIELSEKRMDEKLAQFEHRINDRFDEVIREVRASQEDRVLFAHRVGEHDEVIENHGMRIVRLEKHQEIHE